MNPKPASPFLTEPQSRHLATLYLREKGFVAADHDTFEQIVKDGLEVRLDDLSPAHLASLQAAGLAPAPGPRRVYLASPLSGDIVANQAYAREAMADSLGRGEAPFVPHLLYTQVLDDTKAAEREAGMRAGNAWLLGCDAVVAYVDRGVSRGMAAEIEAAKAAGIPVEERRLPARAVAADGVARCERCNWPLAASLAEGCVPGNCSFRGGRPWEVRP